MFVVLDDDPVPDFEGSPNLADVASLRPPGDTTVLMVTRSLRVLSRPDRRGPGKTEAIDAHLAVLWALRLDADQLPTPRADGDRETLRMLLCARAELVTTATGQVNRLKALLRNGDDRDRALARGKAEDRGVVPGEDDGPLGSII